MRALLDVNVLIALLDANHVSHTVAMAWFGSAAPSGWASCAITQNGCLRVMSMPAYPRARPVHEIAERLREATQSPVHEFWPDDVSLLDVRHVDVQRVYSARQLTDVYLLALAVQHGGCLVTFDHAIRPDAVRGARAEHLVIL